MSVKAGFGVLKDYEGQSGWDETYKSVEIKKRLIPLGPAAEDGEIPYTEEIYEVVTETPIKDVIASQEDSCGLEAYMKPYRLAGTLPPDVEVTGDVQDFTQFDDAGDLRVSGKVEELFGSLPVELQQKYGSPESLLRNITDAAIAEYVASKVIEKPVVEEKEEKKDD